MRAATAAGGPLRLPLAGMLVLVLLIIGGSVAAMAFTGNLKLPTAAGGGGEGSTPTVTTTQTPSPTFTPTATATETPVPTPTPLPPVEYVVQANDTCLKIAAEYNVSWQSIVDLNKLDPNCTLSVGKVLLVPQPTPTPTPLPTATLNPVVVTEVPRTTYTVHAGDTLLGIANFYGITVGDLMEVNGITDPASIREGQVLIIPLERVVTPGPSPTPTLPPPWPAPNQLLPADGQIISAADLSVTLQWTSVGTLRPNEYYYVTVEDVTCNCARFYRQATTETKLIIPATFRPTDASGHIFRWSVSTVREKGTTEGQPEYDSAGATSPTRDFFWTGGPTPAP